MVMLSDVARQVTALNLQEDATKTGSVYGTITNAGVRRRERRGAGARLAAAPLTAAVTEMPTKKPVTSEKVKEEVSETTRKETITTAPAAKKPTPALKRAGSSGLAQAFAKAAAMPKKAPAAKVAATPAKDEDQHMSDDGEDDGEAQPRPASGAVPEGSRKSRKDREEALRRMMDEDDEEEEAEATSKEESAAEEEEPPAEEAPAPAEKEEPAEEVAAPSGDGRRRGRRRVMKKKQVMDDQGYLGKHLIPEREVILRC
jgi:DNA polymerase delta subunit 3